MKLPLIPVTVVVLTYNEERNLSPLLDSLAGWVASVVVVDSGSTDSTCTVAGAFGVRVVTRPFTSHQAQWQWALANLPIETDWVLGLDADQRVTPELRQELEELFAGGDPQGISGFYVKRRQIFRGKWIRHGTYYPKYLLKLFRRDAVRFDECDLIDHHFHVDGPTAKLAQDLIEDNAKELDLSFWMEKHRRYAPEMAREEYLRHRGEGTGAAPRLFGTPDQRTAWLKRLWYRLPLYVRPVLYFVYRYVFRLGFLDGRQGLVFHTLHGLWYRMLIDKHLAEFRAGRSRVDGESAA